MSKGKSRKSAEKTRYGRVVLVWALALLVIVGVTERKSLPAAVQKNAGVAAVYDARDRLANRLRGPEIAQKGARKNAAIEPASGAGYGEQDRKELNSLISRGSYNQ